jgi:hypothetical protein
MRDWRALLRKHAQELARDTARSRKHRIACSRRGKPFGLRELARTLRHDVISRPFVATAPVFHEEWLSAEQRARLSAAFLDAVEPQPDYWLWSRVLRYWRIVNIAKRLRQRLKSGGVRNRVRPTQLRRR